jgi:hypothetical protein
MFVVCHQVLMYALRAKDMSASVKRYGRERKSETNGTNSLVFRQIENGGIESSTEWTLNFRVVNRVLQATKNLNGALAGEDGSHGDAVGNAAQVDRHVCVTKKKKS